MQSACREAIAPETKLRKEVERSTQSEFLAGKMPMITLTSSTQWLVDHFFRPGEREEVARVLATQCANNLPSCEKSTAESLERLHFAAIKYSGGDLKKLHHAVREAQMDWRDLLMATGFGLDMNAHRAWFEELHSK